MANYLGAVELGTLRKDGVEQPRPTKPWWINGEPYSGAGYGNIANFTSLTDMSKWVIGNTSSTPANRLKWHKIQDGDKTLLICDRVILVNVSWNDLNGQGLITGKTITIDGQQYKCRVLTGGAERREGGSGTSYLGGKLPNEWDHYITNELNIPGLPVPSATDLDSNLNAADKDSSHNQFWNWMGAYSWCQETYLHDGARRADRGFFSARFWSYSVALIRCDYVGWRPVLEILNSAPLISGTDQDLGDLTSPPSVTYQVSDPDGDAVSVTEKLNSAVIRTLSNAPKGVDLTVTVTGEQWTALAINTQHTLTITANDGKGGITTRTYTFRRVNAAPVITGTDGSIGDKNAPFQYPYQVTDPDGDDVNVIERFNGQVIRTLENVPLGEDLFVTIDSSRLATVPINGTATISIEATDSAGNVSYRNVTFRRVNAAAVVVTTTPRDLGARTSPPTIIYQVSDPEGDAITVVEQLNGVELRTMSPVTPGEDITLTIPMDRWVRLGLVQHTITIRATDSHGAYSEEVFTFVRVDDCAQVEMLNAVETSARAERIVPSVNAIVPAGAVLTVEVCNNGFDAVPAWEDATAETIQRKAYVFTNETKTAEKWGIKMRVTLERGEAVGECAILGYGAAFE